MWIGIVAALLVNWVIGGVWYHPSLFGHVLLEERKRSKPETSGMGLVHVIGINVFALMEVFGLLYVVTNQRCSTALEGAKWGYFVWQFFVCPSLGVHYLFDGKPIKGMFCKWGQHLVSLMAEAAVIACLSSYQP